MIPTLDTRNVRGHGLVRRTGLQLVVGALVALALETSEVRGVGRGVVFAHVRVPLFLLLNQLFPSFRIEFLVVHERNSMGFLKGRHEFFSNVGQDGF